MLTALAILTDGLVYAAYLFVVAIGLTLIFGVMKILNVAHGSMPSAPTAPRPRSASISIADCRSPAVSW
jgi:hypothetical protein